ncbi:MAG: regulatory protein RecX [Ferruginibacter sp.]
MQIKNIGTEKALQKIRHFCSYQERSHKEVKEKLYSFGLYKEEVEILISKIIEDGYLNEERFAIAFAGGKFRQKDWGKVKIKYELKLKGVSEYCIKKALAEIKENDYLVNLKKLYKKKSEMLKSEKNKYTLKAKVTTYLMQKGYELNLVKEVSLDEAGK